MKRLLRFFCRDDGPTAVEYAVMLALIIVVCLTAISLVGGGTANMWSNNQQQIDNAVGS